MWYNASDLAAAWDRLIAGATVSEVRASANLQHDLVDITREVMTTLLSQYHGRLVDAYRDNNRILLQ